MRIAVVGSGASGSMTSWLLQPEHDVVLFEAASRPGGHAYTVVVDHVGRTVPVELGAEFFFEEGYAGFHALLKRLQVPVVREKLAVSMTIEGQKAFAVPPRHVHAVRSILSPRTLRALLWMQRLAAAAEKVAAERDWTINLIQLIERTKIPRDVANDLIIPLVAASWGVTREIACEMAAYSVVRVMGLRLSHEPHTFRFEHGLTTYIERLIEDSPRCELRLNRAVHAVDIVDGAPVVSTAAGAERFDAVVLACDWHQSASICARSPRLSAWHETFSSFPDTRAHVAVHTDHRYMPPNRRVWGTANFWLTREQKPRTTVWSGQRFQADVFRTWLRDGEEPPASTTHAAHYRHIVITPEHPRRQQALEAMQGVAGIWAAGMYTTGVDNHESALRSALHVAQRLSPANERVRWFTPLVSD